MRVRLLGWWAASLGSIPAVHPQAGEQSVCQDLPLSVDDEPSSCLAAAAALASSLEDACLQYFCSSCSYAGACDATCGWCHTSDSPGGPGGGLGGEEDLPVDLVPSVTPTPQAEQHWGFTGADEAQIWPPEWWPCHADEILDCWGLCRKDTDCRRSGLGLHRCADWLHDLACDDGCSPSAGAAARSARAMSALVTAAGTTTTAATTTSTTTEETVIGTATGTAADTTGHAHGPGGAEELEAALQPACGRRSDSGHTMHFNCPMFHCDAHDCEHCDANPPGVPPNWTWPLAWPSMPNEGALFPASSADDPGSEQHRHRGERRDRKDEGDQNGGRDRRDRFLRLRSQCRDEVISRAGAETSCRALVFGDPDAGPDAGPDDPAAGSESAGKRLSCEGYFCDTCGALAGERPMLTSLLAAVLACRLPRLGHAFILAFSPHGQQLSHS